MVAELMFLYIQLLNMYYNLSIIIWHEGWSHDDNIHLSRDVNSVDPLNATEDKGVGAFGDDQDNANPGDPPKTTYDDGVGAFGDVPDDTHNATEDVPTNQSKQKQAKYNQLLQEISFDNVLCGKRQRKPPTYFSPS